MFKKKTWIKFMTYVGIMMCSIAIFASPATTIVSHAAGNEDIELCTNIRKWVYKIEDGLVYKRLYNASTGLWETDWIYVGVYGG